MGSLLTPSKRRTAKPNFLSPDEVASGKETTWSVLEIMGRVRSLSIELFHYTHLTHLHVQNNMVRQLPAEIGQLMNLVFLDLSHNQLRVIPPEVGDIYRLRELFLDHNSLTTLPPELGRLFNLQKITLTDNPITVRPVSDFMNCEPTPENTTELLYALLELLHPPPHPSSRLTIPVERPNNTKVSACFNVMCYNVLCDKYATRQLYGYCPPWALAWDTRKSKIMEELSTMQAEIITLQEVEADQYLHFFLPELRMKGYEGYYESKSRAKTMGVDEKKCVDGCAIFWRTDHFELCDTFLIEFNELAIKAGKESQDMINRVMPRDNVAIAVLLRTKAPVFQYGMPAVTNQSVPLLVATAHIHWDPEYCDVKLIQTIFLMDALRRIVEEQTLRYRPELHEPSCNSLPLILCGDLNALPDSGVIKYLKEGLVGLNHSDFKGFDEQALQKLTTINDELTELSHEFNLASAYQDEHLLYSTYTAEFKGIIDYIFYSTDYMQVTEVLGPFDIPWFKQNRIPGAPYAHVPSDHFPLLSTFQLPVPYPHINKRRRDYDRM